MQQNNGNSTKWGLILLLILLALAGLIVHYRAHPIFISDKLNPDILKFKFSNFLAFCLSLFDLIVVTLLFLFRKTIVYAYLLNGLLAIYGIVMMVHFSIHLIISKNWPINFESIFVFSTFPQILTLIADFIVGKLLYDLYK